jgi:predicted anti-sigma-YlaC factor YlaD
VDEKIEQKSERVRCDAPDVGDQLLSHVNGRTSGEKQVRIEQHVQHCRSCREEVRFLKAAKLARQEDFAASALAFLKSHA